MKQFRKLVSGALTLSTAIAFSGLGMVSSAYAAPLTDMNVELGTSTGAVSSQYTIKFTTTSADTLKGIRLAFSNRASGTVTKPDSWAAGSATLTSITKDGGADSGWAIDTTNAATGYLYLLNTTGSAVTQNDFVIVLSTITNPSSTVSGGNECDAVANSDTCYIRIETHTEDTVAEIDSATYREDTGVTTFTVVTPVTVTATVDPSLTFTVAAVTSGNLSTNDSNASCANPVTSTSTTLPFGNLGIGIAANRCSQHSLAVATNAPSGYDVYFKFVGTNPLTGTIGSNNIDVFANSSATFGSPQLFNVDPTGTSANVNSGWIGLRSTDIGGFGSNLYAPPAVNNSSTVGDSVMTSSGPDLGTGSNIKYVTLKIAVNALQPADTYTGTAQYNVVARY